MLRAREIADIHEDDPKLLQTEYRPAQRFDRRQEIEALDVYGLDYLQHDAAFLVFKRQ